MILLNKIEGIGSEAEGHQIRRLVRRLKGMEQVFRARPSYTIADPISARKKNIKLRRRIVTQQNREWA